MRVTTLFEWNSISFAAAGVLALAFAVLATIVLPAHRRALERERRRRSDLVKRRLQEADPPVSRIRELRLR